MLVTFLNELICLYTVKWFTVLLTNSSIWTQLKGSKHCCQILIIESNINHLFAYS